MAGDDSGDDDLLVGVVLNDRFRLNAPLGEGGMGRVYEGRQTADDRPVAVKILRDEIESSETRQRIQREARILSTLSHRNLVQFIDFGLHEGSPYLVMEKVGGVSLKQVLDQGRVHLSFVLPVIRQICAGLAAIHDEGVIHRDVKPENIHLVADPNGMLQIRILDFGLAFAGGGDENRLTRTGEIQGTPHYIAPERVKSIDVDPRADLYAIGVMIYEMLAGLPPFVEDTSVEVLMKKVDQHPPPLSEHLTESPLASDIAELADALLEPDPEDRPETAEQVRERVRHIQLEHGLGPVEVGDELTFDDAVSRWVLSRSELDPMLSTAETIAMDESDLEGDDPVREDAPSEPAPGQAPETPEDAARASSNQRTTMEMVTEVIPGVASEDSTLRLWLTLLAILSVTTAVLTVAIFTLEPNAATPTTAGSPGGSASSEKAGANEGENAGSAPSAAAASPASADATVRQEADAQQDGTAQQHATATTDATGDAARADADSADADTGSD